MKSCGLLPVENLVLKELIRAQSFFSVHRDMSNPHFSVSEFLVLERDKSRKSLFGTR